MIIISQYSYPVILVVIINFVFILLIPIINFSILAIIY